MTAIPLVRKAPRQATSPLLHYVYDASPLSMITAPLIYVLALPLTLLDLFVTVYQQICFRAYGIALVPRSRYFVFDRHRLRYLNPLEKVNCGFCSYANGVLSYTREIAARTEAYWCPIKHARPIRDPHSHYDTFFDYGDRAYRTGLDDVRRSVTAPRRRSRRRQ